jgi:hypothetical protein
MGPSDEEADELVRGLRGGSGRNRRNFEKCVDMENLIPVSFASVTLVNHLHICRQTMRTWTR